MTQILVTTLLNEVSQICRNAPTITLVTAYIRAARMFCNHTRWLTATINGSTIAPVTTNYTTGTVTVTNSSANVLGAGTSWAANIAAGDIFTGPNAVAYTVQSVTNDTNLVLTANYAGTTLAGQTYTIARNRSYPLYALGSDTYNEIIGIKALSITQTATDTHPLTEQYSGDWDANDATDVPEFYQYVPEGQFVLHPTPKAVYPLIVSVALQPKRGANSIDDTLAVSWDYALQAGTLAYLLKIPATPWRDVREAEIQMAMFRSYMNQATLSAERGYNAGAALTDHNGGASAGLHTSILPI